MIRSLLTKVLVVALGALALVAMLAVDTTVLAGSPADSPKPERMKAAQAETESPQSGQPGRLPGNRKPSPTSAASFPAHAETEFERSVIRIPIRLAGDTKPREIVELTAFMRLEREAPVRNTIGYRQFEFTIKDWELFGYSEALGAHISFAVSKDTVQPKSLCVSLQKDADFPALIVYNAIYDIYIDGRKVVSQRPGVAMARGVVEIPPRNITVAFQKPVALGPLLDEGASGKSWDEVCPGCPPPFFDPGTCEDMVTITAEEFKAGLQEAKAIREQAATLKPKSTRTAKKAGSR